MSQTSSHQILTIHCQIITFYPFFVEIRRYTHPPFLPCQIGGAVVIMSGVFLVLAPTMMAPPTPGGTSDVPLFNMIFLASVVPQALSSVYKVGTLVFNSRCKFHPHAESPLFTDYLLTMFKSKLLTRRREHSPHHTHTHLLPPQEIAFADNDIDVNYLQSWVAVFQVRGRGISVSNSKVDPIHR